MATFKLYINVRPETGRPAFVLSGTNGAPFQFPAWFREGKVSLELYFQEPNPTGGFPAPFTALTPQAYGCRVGIGSPASAGTAAVILCAENLFWDTDHFAGVLNINTVEMNAVLDASSSAEVSRTFEVELKNGTEEFTFQQAVTIRNEVLTDAGSLPENVDETLFLGLLENTIADVFADTPEVRWELESNDMKARAAVWRDATLSGPLRVETPPVTPHGHMTSTRYYTTAATVSGITGRLYQLDLRVRGLFGLTTYTGGVNFGLINIGGAHSHATGNPITLTVSDPPQTIILNRGSLAENRSARDYRLSITAKAGATLTLLHDTTDLALDPYASEILVPGILPYPAEFDGWFIDCSIEPQIARQTGKETIWIPGAAMTKRTTDGPADASSETTTNKIMVTGLEFDPDTPQFAQFTVAMPKSWNEGKVTAEFIWMAATGTGSARWGIHGVAISDADALDAAFGTAQEVTDALGTVDTLRKTAETSALTIAGTPAAGDLAVFQVYRDADDGADTLTGAATLLGVRLFYNTDAANDN